MPLFVFPFLPVLCSKLMPGIIWHRPGPATPTHNSLVRAPMYPVLWLPCMKSVRRQYSACSSTTGHHCCSAQQRSTRPVRWLAHHAYNKGPFIPRILLQLFLPFPVYLSLSSPFLPLSILLQNKTRPSRLVSYRIFVACFCCTSLTKRLTSCISTRHFAGPLPSFFSARLLSTTTTRYARYVWKAVSFRGNRCLLLFSPTSLRDGFSIYNFLQKIYCMHSHIHTHSLHFLSLTSCKHPLCWDHRAHLQRTHPPTKKRDQQRSAALRFTTDE